VAARLVVLSVGGCAGLGVDRAADHAAGDRIRHCFEITNHSQPLFGATLCGLAGAC
jgi:hypothetical protein